MPLITEQISNLINGVSQQPPALRLASQATTQDNGLVTIAEGLKKRPPLEYIAKLSNKTDTDANVHFINRDATERYIVHLTSDQFSSDFSSDFSGAEMEVWDLDGVSKSVSGATGDVLTYITSANTRDNLKLFTVADFTFLLNKTVTTAKSSTTGDTRAPEGIVFIKQATATTDFLVHVDGTLRSTINADADAATQLDDCYNELVSAIGATFDITKFGSSNVHLTKKDGSDFTLHVQAPEGNCIAIKESVVDFTDLPSRTKDGFIVKVTGSPSSGTDDYWLKHNNQADEDVGEWVETVEPGLANSLDASTMPIQFIRTSEDPWDDAFAADFGETVFSLSQIVWTDRLVGDETTAPDPSFIGEKLNDIFFHKNRFGLLAGENVILSELGEFFNFYNTTATDLLDTDPIDLASPSNQVSILHHSIAFNEDLYLFSNFAQFKLSEFAAGGLTPTNAKLSLLTEYKNDIGAIPILNGRKLYFSEEVDGFSAIREFGTIEDLQEETAEEITSHVPSYIKGKIFDISPHSDFLFVLSDENLNEIFVYKMLFERGVKKLSSWSKWKFKAEEKVIGINVIDHIAYLVIVRPDGTYLDKISLQDANLVNLTESSTQLSFKPHLDRLTEVTGSYSLGADLTSWTIPYPDDFGSTFRVVFGAGFSGKEGDLVQGVSQTTPTTLTASGDHSASSCFIGKDYRFLYEFTEPTIKTEVAGRVSSLSGGILKIRKFNVDYFNTGYFKFQVTAPGRDAFSHIYTGRILGSTLNKIGTIPFETGSFKKLILADSKDLKLELISDSYLPCAFTGADWEGNYVVRTVSGIRAR
jgi:hypothetical protein|tara:strand:+ start:1978 stop:4419 length:2442 start_codon:yes stop_codon:yes gene_type:complete